ncbi:MAG: CRISPR system precrRNA processing endoribonuclease RAMP protein Cas6 [Sandaracinaceae bacterium]|nr:CRISPR system precrRNA processing endoribonuclease RAMP protein Cas6 [Sandaracinaceae bacterium]
MSELDAIVAGVPASVTLRARYRASETVSLPAFLGGTMHGALGHALDAVGAIGLFGPPPAPEDAPGFVRAGVPPPCVMIPPAIAPARELEPGAPLELAVLLVAPDERRVGVLLAALEAMGRRGLGRGRGRLALERVDDGGGRPTWEGGRVVATPEVDVAPAARGDGPWTLRATTPLHLVRRGELVQHPRAAEVVVAAARRLLSLAWTYGVGPTCDLRELEHAASERLAAAPGGDWTRLHGERWSERQRRLHPVEGVLGTLRLDRTAEPYVPLLAQALRFGVGKGTALGLGRLELVLGVS